MTDIGIVGAGVSTTLLIDYLTTIDPTTIDDATSQGDELTITIFDRTPFEYPDSFRSSLPGDCIVNMPVATMSVHSDLMVPASAESRWTTTAFPSRRDYGKYLKTKAVAAVRALNSRPGITVTVIREHVTEVAHNTRGNGNSGGSGSSGSDGGTPRFVIYGSSGTTVTCDKIVFTSPIGIHSQTAKPLNDINLESDITEAAMHDGRVGLLGASLTAIDTILQLDTLGFTGELLLLSRRSATPGIRGTVAPDASIRKNLRTDLLAAAPDGLRSLSHVLERYGTTCPDFDHQSIRYSKPFSRTAMQLLDTDLSYAPATSPTMHSILDSTSPYIDAVWQRLPTSDRSVFLKKYSSRWNSIRHCMPLVNARRLQAAFGRMGISHHRLHHIEGSSHAVVASGADTSRSVHLDRIIDCRGPALRDYGSGRIDDDLRRHGTCCADGAEGIIVDPQTMCALDREGHARKTIYAIGRSTRSTLFYVSSVDVLRIHVRRLADSLFQLDAARR